MTKRCARPKCRRCVSWAAAFVFVVSSRQRTRRAERLFTWLALGVLLLVWVGGPGIQQSLECLPGFLQVLHFGR
jgi:hypothetical protein